MLYLRDLRRSITSSRLLLFHSPLQLVSRRPRLPFGLCPETAILALPVDGLLDPGGTGSGRKAVGCGIDEDLLCRGMGRTGVKEGKRALDGGGELMGAKTEGSGLSEIGPYGGGSNGKLLEVDIILRDDEGTGSHLILPAEKGRGPVVYADKAGDAAEVPEVASEAEHLMNTVTGPSIWTDQLWNPTWKK
ncbi:hypothetical protein FISHEDRAFT_59697 [Fistulina hepatica ATCC 64428]|uniref:Uncharacterized protein n=1 Tax=Fistulina hepatica ATCC 64428 TaxID=1128425 RepID=A0A0D7A8U3_9AGAR|nr:hypothetical protein FISHEDRAFT_59697 [Fistulina hepatica ATCC 64428]